MEHRSVVSSPISVYREFAPRPELREYVRALAWFGPANEPTETRKPAREFFIDSDRELTPSFADADMSLIFGLGVSYRRNAWRPSSTSEATVMGAMTRATLPPNDERMAMIGVYLRPRGAATLLGVPATELTDRIIALRELWKGCTMLPEATTLDNVEALLVHRLSMASPSDRAVRIADLASYVRRCPRQMSVSEMASLAGLSRQHLGRLFLEHVGVSPKLYARLTRFRAALRQIQRDNAVGGCSALTQRHGYADQSHLIAECREFTSFTPRQLAAGDRFHPFIGDDPRQP